ncbi:hypothetical protein AVEN_60100-1 [Araneus ventricosus]|uniref:Uncharacterized protein n=1 Tax=Araneus ventricosus TaxID=182803 RepID=A0A4Y2J8L7_ARAVE|nr:hypothetical protein AVEN_60100-1 [Araneus ventricosus]
MYKIPAKTCCKVSLVIDCTAAEMCSLVHKFVGRTNFILQTSNEEIDESYQVTLGGQLCKHQDIFHCDSIQLWSNVSESSNDFRNQAPRYQGRVLGELTLQLLFPSFVETFK